MRLYRTMPSRKYTIRCSRADWTPPGLTIGWKRRAQMVRHSLACSQLNHTCTHTLQMVSTGKTAPCSTGVGVGVNCRPVSHPNNTAAVAIASRRSWVTLKDWLNPFRNPSHPGLALMYMCIFIVAFLYVRVESNYTHYISSKITSSVELLLLLLGVVTWMMILVWWGPGTRSRYSNLRAECYVFRCKNWALKLGFSPGPAQPSIQVKYGILPIDPSVIVACLLHIYVRVSIDLQIHQWNII